MGYNDVNSKVPEKFHVQNKICLWRHLITVTHFCTVPWPSLLMMMTVYANQSKYNVPRDLWKFFLLVRRTNKESHQRNVYGGYNKTKPVPIRLLSVQTNLDKHLVFSKHLNHVNFIIQRMQKCDLSHLVVNNY